MTLADLIACSIPDARPSTLPDRAPRCLEDELLPEATPLPMPDLAKRSHNPTPEQREARRALDRERAKMRRARLRPGTCVCGRPATGGNGLCWRLLCRT
jgi:hypothetical protein